jgi:hypothetical protein
MRFLPGKRKTKQSRKESSLGISRKYALKPGRSYVVEETPPHMSLDAFVNLVTTSADSGQKTEGIVITRQHPDILREKYGLEETPIYWLATRAGDKVMSPTNLGILANMLVRFTEQTADGVILLDGIEYLVSNNDFGKVLKMVDQVNDHVLQSGCRMIIPVDPRAFDSKQLALLERNMDKLA